MFGVCAFMANINVAKDHSKKRPKCSNIALVGAITALSWLSGGIPTLSKNFSLDWATHAYGQTHSFSIETIWGYAAAVQEIDPIRKDYLRLVNNFYGGNKPPQVCERSDLSAEVGNICSSYKSKSASILRRHGVIGSYNKITSQLKYDRQLERQIQDAMACQQRQISINSCF